MPIRINLLSEAQSAEVARRNDPVKRAAWIGGFLVFLVLLYSASLQLKVVNSRGEAANIEGRWKRIEKDYLAVTDNMKRSLDVQKRLGSLQRLSTNRFLWAPVLNALQQTTVQGIQVVRFRGDHNYTQLEAVTAKPGAKPPVPGRPAVAIEKITMILEAKDYGNPSEQNYNRFKASIANFPFFKQFFPQLDSVKLTSLSSPSPEAGDPSKTFVHFTLEAQFPEVRRDE